MSDVLLRKEPVAAESAVADVRLESSVWDGRGGRPVGTLKLELGNNVDDGRRPVDATLLVELEVLEDVV